VLKKSTPHNFMKTLEELQEDVFESGRLVAKINEQYKSAKKAQAKAIAGLQLAEQTEIAKENYLQNNAPGGIHL
jgi:hypothetical protein